MRAVFDGDRVLVRLTHIDKRGRREAALVQVLECNTHYVVGRLNSARGVQFVIPDNKKITHHILVPPGKEKNAIPGQIVTVQITSQPSYHQQPMGEVYEILGEQRAPGMEIDIAIRTHGLVENFPDSILKALKTSPVYKELVPHKTYPDRQDLRELPLVTIDGEDAMDFDDAVYCEKKARGWRLIVAIADVSYYVKPDSELDKEAFNRGNSVYFPGRALPMLPEILSNDLCSLKPNIDRLALVCDMTLNQNAVISQYDFYPAVIHSHARLTYTQAAKALEGDKKTINELGKLVKPLEVFYGLYQKLLINRHKRGALDFETTETKVIFDESKKIKEIIPVVRNTAHRMIEEAMLCANVCSAEFLVKHKMPALFRVHEGPNEEKLNDLRGFLKEFNLGLRGGSKPSPADYAELLTNIKNRKDTSLITTVLLRSLKQAIYSPDNNGHFGLAYKAYTHFTSPIRRYPDLMVHRQIKQILEKNFSPDNHDTHSMAEKKLYLTADHCSFTERRADEATREALSALKCEFMSNHVGESYEGLITGVTGFGLFVELKGIYIDGLVHITTLPSDYYHFDPARHRLTGERGNLQFNLGDAVKVSVVRVDLDDKKIELELADMPKKIKKSITSKTQSSRHDKRKFR